MRRFVLRCSLVFVALSMAIMVALIVALSHKALAGWFWMREHEMYKHSVVFTITAMILVWFASKTLRDGYLLMRETFKELSSFKG